MNTDLSSVKLSMKPGRGFSLTMIVCVTGLPAYSPCPGLAGTARPAGAAGRRGCSQ
jgi:hypothetical protein